MKLYALVRGDGEVIADAVVFPSGDAAVYLHPGHQGNQALRSFGGPSGLSDITELAAQRGARVVPRDAPAALVARVAELEAQLAILREGR